MEQDPDITYSRFNKRFSNFLWTPLAIFRFCGRLYIILFYFIYFFIELYLPMGLFWGTHFDPVSRAGSPKQSH